jgi:hypothetical protein
LLAANLLSALKGTQWWVAAIACVLTMYIWRSALEIVEKNSPSGLFPTNKLLLAEWSVIAVIMAE